MYKLLNLKNMNKQTIIISLIILIIAIVAAGVFISNGILNNSNSKTTNNQSTDSSLSQNEIVNSSTIQVDNAINDLLKSYDEELQTVQNEDEDADFVTTDSTIINSFSEAYNENAF